MRSETTRSKLPTTSGLVELEIGGMTCATCAARIEKRLNRLDAVTATVNFMTGKARVAFPATLTPADLITTVEQVGYTARVPARPEETSATQAGEADQDRLRTRLLVSVALAVPVVAMAMVPALQFTNWQWLSAILATPVVAYGGWPFHKATWANLRHRAVTMDTLITIGVLAAYGWSMYALFLGTAGKPGTRHGFSFTVQAMGGATPSTWRWPPGSPRPSSPAVTSRSGPSAAPAPRCVPSWSWGPRTSRSCATVWRSASRSNGSPWGTDSWSAPARRLLPTGWSRRAPPRSMPACSPAKACRSRSAPAPRSWAHASTPADVSSSGPPASAPTRSSPRWRSWSRRPRPARPRCSASSTVFAPSSSRSSSRWPWRRSGSGWVPVNRPPQRSQPGWRY